MHDNSYTVSEYVKANIIARERLRIYFVRSLIHAMTCLYTRFVKSMVEDNVQVCLWVMIYHNLGNFHC